MTDKVAALQALTPAAQWVLRGDELEWLDEVQTQPTDSAIEIGRASCRERV